MWALCLVCSSSCQKASAFLSQSSISPLLFSTGWKGSLLPRQRCHHKYNVGFTKWHSLGPPKLSIFLAPVWCQVSKEVQQMTFSLVPCHVSSPGPRWFYLIPESSIVTPDCPSALPTHLPEPSQLDGTQSQKSFAFSSQQKLCSSWNSSSRVSSSCIFSCPTSVFLDLGILSISKKLHFSRTPFCFFIKS